MVAGLFGKLLGVNLDVFAALAVLKAVGKAGNAAAVNKPVDGLCGVWIWCTVHQ